MNRDIHTCHFPEHKDELWENVVEKDRQYVVWLVEGEGPELDDDLYNYLELLLEET